MINLNLGNFKGFQESIIDDSLKAAANVDTGAVKDAWDNADNVIDKAHVINDEIVQKTSDHLSTIDNKLRGRSLNQPSIIARARNSILQFPIYIDQSVRVNEAHIIAKLFERVYTTMVQVVISQNPILDEDEANNLVFLKGFHTNIREAADVLVNKYYEAIDDMDQMMQDSIFYTQKLTENCTVTFSVIPTTNKDLILENTRLMNEPLTGFMYLKEDTEKTTENNTNTTTKETVITLSDQDIRDMAMNEINLSQEDRRLMDMSDVDIEKDINIRKQSTFPPKLPDGATQDEKDEYAKKVTRWKEDRDKAVASKITKRKDIEKTVDSEVDVVKRKIKAGKMGERYKYKNGRYVRVDQGITTNNSTKTTERPKLEKDPSAPPVETAPSVPTILRDNDIKKINGMDPYSVEISFRLKTKTGVDRDLRYVIGIKSVLHPIRTQDLADELQELVTGNIRSLQKVRYKTGEIGFLDYLFNIKGIKNDASKHINYNKRWINTLKRLAEYGKMNGSLLKNPAQLITGGNVPIPNGTLILTQPAVTTLTNQTGIDLSVVSNAKRLAQSLFLIAVVIVDSSAGTMKVLFPDNDVDWDVQSLASIDAEVSKTDNSQLMKELNRLVNGK